MKFKSTGLGETELVGDIAGFTRQGDYLILHIHTTQPIRWHIRAGLTYRDIVRLMAKAFRLTVICFLLFGLIRRRAKGHTADL